MVAVSAGASAIADAIAEQVFVFLWGDERGPLPTAGDHAYRRIWCQLITGARRAGERLSDVELAGQLGVSRTPVRQALHRLAQDELVRFDPRRGFWVREFTAKDVHEMYDVRAALEALALRQAAPHLRPEDIHAQLGHIEAMRALLPERPVVPCLQHDFELHNLLIHASGNGRLIRLLAGLRSQVSIFQIRDAGYPGRLEMALDAHERVLVALLGGRTEEAARLMVEHIEEAKAAVLADMFDGKEVKP
jgi:DNA-binding GntR family transcriptional regulator